MKHIVNEDELYHLIQTWCSNPDKDIGIGDDAAVLRFNKSRLVATTDSLVEHIHFQTHWVTPTYLGQKAGLTNISDFSAMGAIPKYALVSLILPEIFKTKQFLKKLYKGLSKEFSRHNITIVGGNTSSGKELSITVTLFGYIDCSPITRSGGRAGDLILCTGYLGDAAHELSRLLSGRQKYIKTLPPDRLIFGQQLAQQKIATSTIDISDGLSRDLARLCTASKVGAKIYEKKLPVSPVLLTKIISDKQREEWTLHGGEVYELLFTAPKNNAAKIQVLAKKTSTPVCVIGEIDSTKKILIERKNGTISTLIPQGWDHFRSEKL